MIGGCDGEDSDVEVIHELTWAERDAELRRQAIVLDDEPPLRAAASQSQVVIVLDDDDEPTVNSQVVQHRQQALGLRLPTRAPDPPAERVTFGFSRVMVGTLNVGPCDVRFDGDTFEWSGNERNKLPNGQVGHFKVGVNEIVHIEVNKADSLMGIWVWDGDFDVPGAHWAPEAARGDARSCIKFFWKAADYPTRWPSQIALLSNLLKAKMSFIPIYTANRRGYTGSRMLHKPDYSWASAGAPKSGRQQDSTRQQQAPIAFGEAMDFVTKVKRRVDVGTYKAFLEMLRAHQMKKETTEEVYRQASTLFKNHADLISQFSEFLPEDGPAPGQRSQSQPHSSPRLCKGLPLSDVVGSRVTVVYIENKRRKQYCGTVVKYCHEQGLRVRFDGADDTYWVDESGEDEWWWETAAGERRAARMRVS